MSDLSSARLARMRGAMQRHVDSGYTPGLVTYVHHLGREHVDTTARSTTRCPRSVRSRYAIC